MYSYWPPPPRLAGVHFSSTTTTNLPGTGFADRCRKDGGNLALSPIPHGSPRRVLRPQRDIQPLSPEGPALDGAQNVMLLPEENRVKMARYPCGAQEKTSRFPREDGRKSHSAWAVGLQRKVESEVLVGLSHIESINRGGLIVCCMVKYTLWACCELTEYAKGVGKKRPGARITKAEVSGS